MDSLIEPSDFFGQDHQIVHELSHVMTLNTKRNPGCYNVQKREVLPNVPRKKPLIHLNSRMVDEITNVQLPIGQFGIVSPDRKRATALLSKAALTLHYGDFVEIVFNPIARSLVIVRLRRLWKFYNFRLAAKAAT